MQRHEYQCPFCEQSSPKPQGLTAHIRNRHPKHYPKWLKTPTRLTDAKNGSATVKEPSPPESPREASAVQNEVPVPASAQTDSALELLKKAHAELSGRKRTIETELAHMTELTKELETVNAQIQALDSTLNVFQARAVA